MWQIYIISEVTEGNSAQAELFVILHIFHYFNPRRNYFKRISFFVRLESEQHRPLIVFDIVNFVKRKVETFDGEWWSFDVNWPVGWVSLIFC